MDQQKTLDKTAEGECPEQFDMSDPPPDVDQKEDGCTTKDQRSESEGRYVHGQWWTWEAINDHFRKNLKPDQVHEWFLSEEKNCVNVIDGRVDLTSITVGYDTTCSQCPKQWFETSISCSRQREHLLACHVDEVLGGKKPGVAQRVDTTNEVKDLLALCLQQEESGQVDQREDSQDCGGLVNAKDNGASDHCTSSDIVDPRISSGVDSSDDQESHNYCLRSSTSTKQSKSAIPKKTKSNRSKLSVKVSKNKPGEVRKVRPQDVFSVLVSYARMTIEPVTCSSRLSFIDVTGSSILAGMPPPRPQVSRKVIKPTQLDTPARNTRQSSSMHVHCGDTGSSNSSMNPPPNPKLQTCQPVHNNGSISKRSHCVQRTFTESTGEYTNSDNSTGNVDNSTERDNQTKKSDGGNTPQSRSMLVHCGDTSSSNSSVHPPPNHNLKISKSRGSNSCNSEGSRCVQRTYVVTEGTGEYTDSDILNASTPAQPAAQVPPPPLINITYEESTEDAVAPQSRSMLVHSGDTSSSNSSLHLHPNLNLKISKSRGSNSCNSEGSRCVQQTYVVTEGTGEYTDSDILNASSPAQPAAQVPPPPLINITCEESTEDAVAPQSSCSTGIQTSPQGSITVFLEKLKQLEEKHQKDKQELFRQFGFVEQVSSVQVPSESVTSTHKHVLDATVPPTSHSPLLEINLINFSQNQGSSFISSPDYRPTVPQLLSQDLTRFEILSGSTNAVNESSGEMVLGLLGLECGSGGDKSSNNTLPEFQRDTNANVNEGTSRSSFANSSEFSNGYVSGNPQNGNRSFRGEFEPDYELAFGGSLGRGRGRGRGFPLVGND